MARKIKISEKIQLSDDLEKAYDHLRLSYEKYKITNDSKYSFDEYLFRCGLSALLEAFEKQISEPTVGHA